MNPLVVKAWDYSHSGRLFSSFSSNLGASHRQLGVKVEVSQLTRPLSSCWRVGPIQTRGGRLGTQNAVLDSTEGKTQVRSALGMMETWVFKSCRK